MAYYTGLDTVNGDCYNWISVMILVSHAYLQMKIGSLEAEKIMEKNYFILNS